MGQSVGWNLAAGVVAGGALAGVDLGLVLRDTGPLWPSVSFIANGLAVYLTGGALAGLAVGTLAGLLRRRGPESPDWFANLAGALSFGFLTLLGWIHVFDIALGVADRRDPLPYVAVVAVALAAGAAVGGVLRLILGRLPRRGGVAATTVAAIGVVIGGLLAWRFSANAPVLASSPDRPNVVLFVMDTTRYDSLAGGGNPSATTPHLDRLAREGMPFLRAYATAPWTPPSHASMFTGRYPSRHGTYSHQVRLKDDFPTLAERFGGAGYETLFVASKGLLLESNGWTRGFENAVTVNVEHRVSLMYERLLDHARNADPTERTLDLVLHWLRARDRGRPFFLFVNVSVQHTPYVPRRPALDRLAARVDMSKVDLAKVGRVAKDQDGLELVNDGHVVLNEAELGYLRCLYHAEGTYLDAQVGRFFDGLRAASRRSTYALITSDHGEMLGEHDLLSHGRFLWDELIHVPVILWGAGSRPPSTRLVSLTDVYPTLLALAEIEADPVDGTDLLAPSNRKTVFAETFPSTGARKAVLADDHKRSWEAAGSGGLYDLATDAGEQSDLSGARPGLARALAATLAYEFDLGGQDAAPPEPDPEARDLLRSLGYLE